MLIRTATPEDREGVRGMFLEYARSLPPEHICFSRFEEELENLDREYSTILLAFVEDSLAGCVAVRPLGNDVCEMKRLYVRPLFRGAGLGRGLIQAALNWAREHGFAKMRLDTLPEFAAAIALYQQFRFQRIPAYANQPEQVCCFQVIT